MEEQTMFKVYASSPEDDKPEVRRFGIDNSVRTSFHYLNAKLQDVFPRLKNKYYTISWKDEEEDDVIIGSDEELGIALMNLDFNSVVKLYLYYKNEEPNKDGFHITVTAVPDGGQASSSIPHLGVVCDGCDGPVVGFRYKCTVCEDFDLCSTCEAAHQHPEHCMVRLPVPNLPSAVIKNTAKRYRHFLKTVTPSHDEEHCKRQRRERSGDRKRHGHGGHHGHRHHAGDGDHHRRNRTSWLETFAGYMNEFANLAGDVNIETENSEPKPKPQSQQEPNKTEPQAPKASTKDTPTQKSKCQFNMETLDVQNIQKLLNLYMGHFNTSTPNKPSTSTATDNAESSSANNEDVVMGEGDGKASENDNQSVVSDTASSTKTVESKKEESPDKGDEWTVINKENDLMDAGVKENRPIGFNLPKEFQERMNITEGQTLYPPLNAATAVLNPKEPEQPTVSDQSMPASQPASTSTDSPMPSAPPSAEKAQPTPKQRKPHPMAHIEAAIEHMIAMGFTNEGGWLTQLLESKDGNIAAVLDLLTPVNPKK